MAELIRNSLKTPDGTEIVSIYTHDYVTHLDENGKTYMVDGGNDYLKRSCNGDEVDTSVYANDSHDKVRDAFTWGTYGPNGDQPYKRVKLKDMTDGHIEAILETQTQISNSVRNLLVYEIYYRGQGQ